MSFLLVIIGTRGDYSLENPSFIGAVYRQQSAALHAPRSFDLLLVLILWFNFSDCKRMLPALILIIHTIIANK